MGFIDFSGWQIHDANGRRRYVSADERRRFLAVADGLPAEVRALCFVLAYSGCRVTEALNLGRHQLDLEGGAIVLRTLKRRKLIFRTVPMPSTIMTMIVALPPTPDGRLWKMHRATAWRHVKDTLAKSGVTGPMACCRGLRHGFGIHAAQNSIPQSLIQRWMGHASPETTAIYLDAVGVEERAFAARMWPTHRTDPLSRETS